MTVSALCAAAIGYRDDTAANLLVDLLGGPPAATAFARSLGDQVTPLDRTEPTLNDVPPGDQRDTTTPLLIAVYTVPAHPAATSGAATGAEAARATARALAP